jgi:GntR family transcriptional repressor for pyruvate dehydrogenase complex
MAESSRQRRPSPEVSSESPVASIAAATVISRSEKKSERLARYLIDQCKQLEPGTLLASEASMAEAFGVGRTTVREALRLLEVNGFVTVKTGLGGGAYVREVSSADYGRMSSLYFQAKNVTGRQLTQARDLIEPLMVNFLATDLSDEARARIEQVLAEHQRKDATAPENFIRISRSMHSTLAESVRNPVLAFFGATVTGLYSDQITYRLYTPQHRKQILAQHREICEAVLAGQGDSAEKLMFVHLRNYQTMAAATAGREEQLPIEWQ